MGKTIILVGAGISAAMAASIQQTATGAGYDVLITDELGTSSTMSVTHPSRPDEVLYKARIAEQRTRIEEEPVTTPYVRYRNRPDKQQRREWHKENMRRR